MNSPLECISLSSDDETIVVGGVAGSVYCLAVEGLAATVR